MNHAEKEAIASKLCRIFDHMCKLVSPADIAALARVTYLMASSGRTIPQHYSRDHLIPNWS